MENWATFFFDVVKMMKLVSLGRKSWKNREVENENGTWREMGRSSRVERVRQLLETVFGGKARWKSQDGRGKRSFFHWASNERWVWGWGDDVVWWRRLVCFCVVYQVRWVIYGSWGPVFGEVGWELVVGGGQEWGAGSLKRLKVVIMR